MRHILLSVKKRWADLILSGRKTVELRKTCPKGEADSYGFIHKRDWVYIVSTPGTHIVGKCIANLYTHCEGKLDDYAPGPSGLKFLEDACVTREEYESYAPKYTWELSYAVRFQHPVPLAEIGVSRSPQSWQYMTEQQAQIATERGCTSKLDDLAICNKALFMLGEPPIEELDPAGLPTENLCCTLYRRARREVLISYPSLWDFAQRRVVLDAEKDPIYIGGIPAGIPHVEPADCLKVLSVESPERCELTLNRIYSPTETVEITYIAEVTDTSLYPARFTEALSTLLACWLCVPLGGHNLKKRELFNDYKRICGAEERSNV